MPGPLSANAQPLFAGRASSGGDGQNINMALVKQIAAVIISAVILGGGLILLTPTPEAAATLTR